MKFKLVLTLLLSLPNFILANNQTNNLGLDQQIDKAFQPFSDLVSKVVFFEIFEGAPFVIVLLVFSAFFLLYTLPFLILNILAKLLEL